MSRTASVEINLDAVTHNLGIVRHYTGDARVMAVIKANAYGHGMLQVAQHIQNQVDAMAVACVSEAIELRQAGIRGRLVILQGFADSEQLDQCQQFQLEPVCHQMWQVELLNQIKPQLSVWIKVDTGMHRLGLSVLQTEQAFSKLSQLGSIRAVYLMSHFANADEPEHPLNQQQVDCFNQLEQRLRQQGFEFETSFANSAAIIAGLASDKDWVRPGIMLYGSTPMLHQTAAQLNLIPVMNFFSQVIAIHPLEAGQAIGYGSSWVAEQETTIAIVAVGYGDGYPRHADTGTPVIINHQRFELVGRVSMDMICVDISRVADDVEVGDRALIWGAELSVDEIAKHAETIGYELLCQAGSN